MRKYLVATAVSAAFALAGAAQAATVTFNAEPNNFETPVLAEGFKIDFATQGWCLCDGVDGFDFSSNGTKRLLASGGTSQPGALISLSLIGGGLFSVSGFDAATAFLGGSNSLTVTGTHADASTATANFNLSDVHAGFSLGAAFDNLVSLSFAGSAGSFREPGLSIDNLIVNERTAAVPEPTTWAIMLIGFFGLGATVRRRRALAAIA